MKFQVQHDFQSNMIFLWFSYILQKSYIKSYKKIQTPIS